MNVELINDEQPWGLRVGGDGLSHRPRKVFLSPAWPDGRRHDFSRRHIDIGDQALSPMTAVCRLGALDKAGLHRQRGGGALQCLSPGLLIWTEAMPSLLGHSWRVLIHCTHGCHLCRKRHWVIRLGVEPVLYPMRLSIGLIVK